MISRVWHGWTTPANADAYEALLKREIVPGILDRGTQGSAGCRYAAGNTVKAMP